MNYKTYKQPECYFDFVLSNKQQSFFQQFRHKLFYKEQNGKKKGQMGFVPVEQVRLLSPIMETVWADAGNVAALKNRQLYPKELAGENVLLCKIDQKVYALRNACLDSVLPMQFGTVDGYHLVCPWHDCRYDIRNST